MSDEPYVAANVERFMGFADLYDRYRPTPPTVYVDILTQLARTPRPHRVVDVGSGTGLSTRIWADRADEVIGVEPSDDMRCQAEARSAGLTNVHYQKGLSIATGLPDGCADIVTISQALHWMEPVGTFAEVARLLRPGGIFAAIDNDWPPVIDWEAEAADSALMQRAHEIAVQRGIDRDVQRWSKHQHLERIRASGHFRYTREIAVHHVESGTAERMVGLALSQGALQTLLKKGIPEEEIGIPAFRAELQRILGDKPRPIYFTYRIRIGVSSQRY